MEVPRFWRKRKDSYCLGERKQGRLMLRGRMFEDGGLVTPVEIMRRQIARQLEMAKEQGALAAGAIENVVNMSGR